MEHYRRKRTGFAHGRHRGWIRREVSAGDDVSSLQMPELFAVPKRAAYFCSGTGRKMPM